MPLQSEASLKCHLHCLGPRRSIAGYPCEWVATARFTLGATGEVLMDMRLESGEDFQASP
ncbi:Putative protein of unknown function [Podospora comata]|uniref:Uncharacterized protein n=2 Tax=Podosporaceae TaxID=2609812 RepID=A0ABY6S792_PODCO|nr:hypothetical protein QBC40DRAFT_276296 [Triangularia verruculosa]VBB77947.1 Putative protein of unknown function [Podospora comata]